MIGDAFGNYRIVAQLGSGSMGVVFLAEHQRIVRRAAIKLLAPELARDQHALQRFFNEARATSLMRHPGVVEIFDCDVDANGRAYIVMEHLEGETLAERLRRTGSLRWPAACLIARRVADALASVHEKGIVHRDLKTDNVFLVENGRDPAAAVKVLDFGVAKLLTADAVARLTTRGMMVGTPEYMSPEQCAGTDVDHRADIYALGCILFEMVAGRGPFVTSTVRELVVAHRFRPPPSAMATCADVPAWLDDLLKRMLAKEPDRRPSSMLEVSKALCEFKALGRKPATRAVAPAKPVGRGEAGRSARGPAATMVSPLRAHRAAVTIALAALVVVAGAVWAARRNTVLVRPPGEMAQVVVTGEIRRSAPRAVAGLPATVLKANAALLPVNVEAPRIPISAVGLDGSTAPAVRKRAPPAHRGQRARPAPPEARRVVDSDGIVDL
jgi:tRNA A-37 threonylcarbamoyl transferase component Bud32